MRVSGPISARSGVITSYVHHIYFFSFLTSDLSLSYIVCVVFLEKILRGGLRSWLLYQCVCVCVCVLLGSA